jgi:hypothetical protein
MKYGFANFWKEGISALGHKRTSDHVQSMSALPPKADIETGPVISFDATTSGSLATLAANPSRLVFGEEFRR